VTPASGNARLRPTGPCSRVLLVACLAAAALLASPARALDPPHDASYGIECLTCHVPHGAPGAPLAAVEGNANLCLTCHTTGGLAAPRAFADSDQAQPGFSGNSHRWDSGQSGHVRAVAGVNTSTGIITSGGAFIGRVGTTYTLEIITAGDAGAATFDYASDFGGSGAGLLSGNDVILEQDLRLRFTDGSGSPSFKAGDQWKLYVQPDIDYPVSSDPDWSSTTKQVTQRLMPQEQPFNTDAGVTWAKVVCSTCHDQHSQKKTPFDPAAPPFAGSGTGMGRHFQRIDNRRAAGSDATNQLCLSCHNPRDVQTSDGGSHPIRVDIPGSGDFQAPPDLPLDTADQVVCMTCHAPHVYSGVTTSDGYLLRATLEDNAICENCHTLADTAGGSHFSASDGALWPGGEYGSNFPTHSVGKRGACVNCHWPHGWPDDDPPVDLDGNGALDDDYPKLWVERYDVADDHSDPDDAEDLCYTCHDGTPAATDIRGDFLKGSNGTDIFHHPVMDSEQSAGRSVECVDCHNPHKATPANRYAGVDGVELDGTVTDTVEEATQYKLCFNCHGDTYNSARANTSNKRLDFNTGNDNSGYHPVTQVGRNLSANLATQLADSGSGLTTSSTIRCTDCHNSDATDGTPGPVVDSPTLTQGPHGSDNALILRANFTTDYSNGGWSNDNAALCFLCHDQGRLLSRKWDDGARTNFYQDNGKDNLHWHHLSNKNVTSSCLSCHFDIHSNRTASNTQYRYGSSGNWNICDKPPAGVKTHLVNFAPDVQANNFSKPRWQINTSNGTRRCDVSCHGKEMDGENYEPPSGDDTAYTYGAVSCPP